MQDSPLLLENPFDMLKDEQDHHYPEQHLLPWNISAEPKKKNDLWLEKRHYVNLKS